MSRYHEEKIICPSCGKEGNFLVWDSINTVINPEMKEKVRNRSAFAFICPHCHQSAEVQHQFLYHQMEDNLMIYQVNEKEVGTTQELFLNFKTETKSEYIFRIVRSREELLEKLKIFDAGLDDRIVEVEKIFLLAVIMGKCPEKKIEQSFFVHNEKEDVLVYLTDKREQLVLPLNKRLYQDIEGIFASHDVEAQTENTFVIDYDWAAELLDKLLLSEKEQDQAEMPYSIHLLQDVLKPVLTRK